MANILVACDHVTSHQQRNFVTDPQFLPSNIITLKLVSHFAIYKYASQISVNVSDKTFFFFFSPFFLNKNMYAKKNQLIKIMTIYHV